MGGFLSRLTKGLAVGVESYGTSMLEEKRQARLEKMRSADRSANQEFQQSERLAGQEFRADQKASSQEFSSDQQEDAQAHQKDLASMRADSKESRPLNIQNKKMEKDTQDRETGSYTYTQGGQHFRYDKATDSISELGKGSSQSERAIDDTEIAVIKKEAEAAANKQAGLFSGDSSDFPNFKDEKKAAEALTKHKIQAYKSGTLDEFESKFAEKGFKFIHDLEEGGPSKEPSQPASRLDTQPASQSKSADDMVSKFIGDFDGTEEEALEAFINNAKIPQVLKDAAKKRQKNLSTSSSIQSSTMYRKTRV